MPQFRHAAVPIAANIAERFRKHSKADKMRFYNIMRGLVEECRYYLILTKDLEYSHISEAKLLWRKPLNYWKPIARVFQILNTES